VVGVASVGCGCGCGGFTDCLVGYIFPLEGAGGFAASSPMRVRGLRTGIFRIGREVMADRLLVPMDSFSDDDKEVNDEPSLSTLSTRTDETTGPGACNLTDDCGGSAEFVESGSAMK
jgi:hypothetical protein